MAHQSDKPKWLRLSAAAATAFVAASALVAWRTSHLPSLFVTVLFAAMVVASENLALKFPTRVTISPQLILVMAAIVAFRGQGTVLGALVVGACGGLVLKAFQNRRYSLVVFNLSQFGLSAAGSAWVYSELLRAGSPLALLYPVTAASYVVVNSGLVIPAAAVRSGTSLREVWRDVRSSEVNDFIFGLLGLLLGILYRFAGPVAVVVIVAPAIVARSVFVSVVRFRQAFHRLESLYEFTNHLQRAREETDAVSALLEELSRLLSVSLVEITVLTEGGWRRTALGPEMLAPAVTEGLGQSAVVRAAAEGPRLGAEVDEDGGPAPHYSPTDRAFLADIERRELSEVMICPLRSEDRLIGAVLVADPADDRHLGPADLRMLETLANHAAVSLENSRLIDQLRYESHHDELTGLPNRSRFNEMLLALPAPTAILLIDLDRFQEINDTLGHDRGDLLLKRVAERVSDELGRKGIVARLGGDEFGVLLPQTNAGDATQEAVALLSAIERPFAVEDLELEVTASIGVAAAGAEEETAKLLQRADVAMNSAKSSHSGWELYSPERDHYSPQRLALAGELRRAIEGSDLEVHYQPKAEIATGTIVGLEALVRWRHSRHGLLKPDQFVPVAEHAGLIRPLTLLVLADAARRHTELREMGFDLDLAVNLSVRSVLDVNFPDQVAQILAEYSMRPSALTLEITEGSVMADPARTIGILGRLAALGASVSVDDFGTGYSSLSYLKRLPANEVKIDRTFVAGMLRNSSDAAIVRSTVDLARNLSMTTVAEGVEDLATWEALRDAGCQQAQGYLISPPLPPEELATWLARSTADTEDQT